MTIKIANKGQLVRDIEKEVNKRLKAASEEAKQLVLVEAQNACPEDTGHLRLSLADSSVTKITDDGLGFQVGSALDYAWNVEYGTYVSSTGAIMHKDPTNPATMWMTKATRPNYKNPAATMPYLRPAFIRNMSKILAIYKKHFKP